MPRNNSTGKIRKLRRRWGGELLLMEAEYLCYKAGQRYYRRQLLANLSRIDRQYWPFWHAIGDNTKPILERSFLTLSALLALPLSALFQLLASALKLIKFPFQLLASFSLPQNLHAPGEKNLTGLHNAFSAKLGLRGRYYIRCVDNWLDILYPEQVRPGGYLSDCIEKVGRQVKDALEQGLDDPEFRLIGNCREKLSQHYGHYASRSQ